MSYWRKFCCALLGHEWRGYFYKKCWETARFCERCGKDTAPPRVSA